MTELVDTIVSHLDKEEQQKLTKWNIETLNKFDEYNKRIHVKPITRDCQTRILSAFVRDVGKTFSKMTKEDVEGYFDRLTVKPYTIEHRRLVIVKFFKWLYKKDEPKVVSGLEPIRNCYDKTIDVSDLWTDEDIKQLVQACDNSRDKAFIMTLYDSGARIGELRAMNIEDVHFEGDMCFIFLPDSKTKKRRVGLLFAVPYLKTWLDFHPYKTEKGHPLWISFSDASYGKRLAGNSTFDILNSMKKRAGIKKKINHHIMRHSRISIERRSGMKDVFVRKRHGLAPGSNVLERYTWVEEQDTYNDYRESMGYKPLKPVREDPEILKPVKCLCGAENPCDAKFCHKCRLPLKLEEVEHTMNLIEMFRSNFAMHPKVRLDSVYAQYNHLKQEVSLLEHFLTCFDGGTIVQTVTVRKYFKDKVKLTDDQVIELLGILVGDGLIDIVGEKIFLLDRKKFAERIDSQKQFVKSNK